MKFVIALSCLAFLSLGTASHGLEVLTPKDRAVLREPMAVLLGTAESGSSLEWRLENSRAVTRGALERYPGGRFAAVVPLADGLNQLRVGEELRILYVAREDATVPAGFGVQREHAGTVRRCVDCHESDLELRAGGYPGVCLDCHVVEAQNPGFTGAPGDDDHYRSAGAKCGRCHDPHAATEPSLLLAAPAELCGSCHGVRGEGAGKHPAHAEVGCGACHEPHLSGYAMNLRRPVSMLCRTCHEQGRSSEDDDLHPPLVEERSCVGCHGPHGEDGGLTRAPARVLCAACHGEVLSEGHGEDLAECNDCHDPHGLLGTGLVRPEFAERCRECHEDPGLAGTVHPALSRGCNACHDPHSDRNVVLARSRCTGCHGTDAEGDLGRAHGGLSLASETCVGCHPPHASTGERLVRGDLHFPLTQGKCTLCHEGSGPVAEEPTDTARRCRLCHPFERELASQGAGLHEPVADGECVTCHDPHMSTRPDLLRGTVATLCGQCHEQGAAKPGDGLHSAVSDCCDCHHPHGGGSPAFLAAPGDGLCTKCHEDPAAHARHVHGALAEGCLACHDPHSGQGGVMLRSAERELCLGCHDDPAGTSAHVEGSLERGCSVCHAAHGSEAKHLLRSDRSAARPGGATVGSSM